MTQDKGELKKKEKREEGRGEQAEAAPRACKIHKAMYCRDPTRRVYCHHLLLGVWYSYAGSKDTFIAR
jgi:hypothetical protein